MERGQLPEPRPHLRLAWPWTTPHLPACVGRSSDRRNINGLRGGGIDKIWQGGGGSAPEASLMRPASPSWETSQCPPPHSTPSGPL